MMQIYTSVRETSQRDLNQPSLHGSSDEEGPRGLGLSSFPIQTTKMPLLTTHQPHEAI